MAATTDLQKTAEQILSSLPDILTYVRGPKDRTISRPCSLELPCDGGLAFLADAKSLSLLRGTDLACLIVHEKILPQLEGQFKDTAICTSPDVHVAMARIIEKNYNPKALVFGFEDEPIHPTAVVHTTATLGDNVIIGPNSVIGEHCKIGEGTVIGPLCALENNVTIGKNSRIHAQVFLGRDVVLGNECEIFPQSTIGSEGYGYATDKNNIHTRKRQLGRVILEDKVEIGSGVCIDRGMFDDTIIGAGSKIDNNCHFGHNAQIGKNAIITAGFIMAGSAKIGDNFTTGGRSTINGHISLADNITLAANTSVPKSLTQSGIYGGYPPESYTDHKKTLMTLPHIKHMRKTLAKVVKKLGLED